MGTIISSAPPAKILSIFNPDDFSAVTGTTVETITGSVLIPANTTTNSYNSVGVAELTARILKTGILGGTTLRVHTNTVDNLTGAILLATAGGALAADLFHQISRTLFIAKSPIDTKVALRSAQIYSDDSRFTTVESANAIDWSVDQYIILTVQNANAADSTIGSGILFKIYK